MKNVVCKCYEDAINWFALYNVGVKCCKDDNTTFVESLEKAKEFFEKKSINNKGEVKIMAEQMPEGSPSESPIVYQCGEHRGDTYDTIYTVTLPQGSSGGGGSYGSSEWLNGCFNYSSENGWYYRSGINQGGGQFYMGDGFWYPPGNPNNPNISMPPVEPPSDPGGNS